MSRIRFLRWLAALPGQELQAHQQAAVDAAAQLVEGVSQGQ
jgi:hypothetical protein